VSSTGHTELQNSDCSCTACHELLSFTVLVCVQHDQLEQALSSAADKPKLQEQISRLGQQANQWSLQLAHMHEARDKALVDMSRLEEVAPLARNEHGVNKRMVSVLLLTTAA